MRFSGVLILLLTASTALGGEFAVLSTGSRIRADRHETDGGKVRLYSGSGYIELDASQVTSFEAAPDPASSVPAPAVVPPPAPPTQSPAELAEAAAHKYGLPANLVRSVMAAESANRPTAISPKGAIGLMQLMPSTAKDLGVDPTDPVQNVDGGARLLRDLLLKYDGRLWHALAAYNAGPGAVQKYHNSVPPYRETINYVNRIDRAYRKSSEQPVPPAPQVSDNN